MIIFLYSSYLWLFFILLAGWVTAFIFIFKENKHKISFFLSFLILALIIWSGINFGPVQNFLVKKVTAVLSKKLQTRVSVKHVDVGLFNKLIVEGVLVEDKKKDTLL